MVHKAIAIKFLLFSGSPNFNQAQSWTSPQPGGNNPGAGDVQAWASVVYGTVTNQTLYQEVWQSNTRWRRTVPVYGGIPSWSSATNWISGLGDFGTQPGDPSTDTQATNSYILYDKLYQGYWRGDKGYSRKVQLVNGVPDWNLVGAWGTGVLINTLPGSGDMRAQDNFTFCNRKICFRCRKGQISICKIFICTDISRLHF